MDIGRASGVAITTRVRVTEQDDEVLRAVAAHTSKVRRADLAVRTREPQQDNVSRNARSRGMIVLTSGRMAGTAVRGNDDQYRLARRAQSRDIRSLRAGCAAITKRLAAPVGHDGKRGKARGYKSQAERAAKQQRLQVLTARLRKAERDQSAGVVHVVSGGKHLLQNRHHLDEAGLSLAQWRERWDAARDVSPTSPAPATDSPQW